MTELKAQALLETMQGQRAAGSRLKKLANGDWIIVTQEAIYLWNEKDARRYCKGNLKAQKLARKELEVPV